MASNPAMLILVDKEDRPIGFEERLAAHRNGGLLHRAFSIFVFNRQSEMLLQKRSARKYRFRGSLNQRLPIEPFTAILSRAGWR